jgi:hypothetical protein
MSNQIKTGRYVSDGETIYLPLGFIPHKFELVDISVGSSHVILYQWKKQLADEATGYQEGWSITEGVTALLADDAGINSHDSASESPNIYVWTASTTTLLLKGNSASTTTKTARTVTAHGTYIIPLSTSYDRSTVFECVTASGNTGATEPDWTTAPAVGDQIADGSNVWERVNVATAVEGYKGVRIAGDIQTDSRIYYFEAVEADEDVNFGDVDGWVGGVYGA